MRFMFFGVRFLRFSVQGVDFWVFSSTIVPYTWADSELLTFRYPGQSADT